MAPSGIPEFQGLSLDRMFGPSTIIEPGENYISIALVEACLPRRLLSARMTPIVWGSITDEDRDATVFGLAAAEPDSHSDQATSSRLIVPHIVAPSRFSMQLTFGAIAQRDLKNGLLSRAFGIADRPSARFQVPEPDGSQTAARDFSNALSYLAETDHIRTIGMFTLSFGEPIRPGLYALRPVGPSGLQRESGIASRGTARDPYLVIRINADKERPDWLDTPGLPELFANPDCPFLSNDLTPSQTRAIAQAIAETRNNPPIVHHYSVGANPPFGSDDESVPGSDDPRQQPENTGTEASAFAPTEFVSGRSSLVSIAVHLQSQRGSVLARMTLADSGLEQAGASAELDGLKIGANVDIVLQSPSATITGEPTTRIWKGKPLFFDFFVEPQGEAVPIVAKVIVDGAQIGSIAFSRPVTQNANAQQFALATTGLDRPRKVFVSYSRADSDRVALVVGAYTRAGIPVFFDRTSIPPGADWQAALRSEIDGASLFHLCWSHDSARSTWVREEVNHALSRKLNTGSEPDFTIQMMHPRPWPDPPPEWSHLNFADFLRDGISAAS